MNIGFIGLGHMGGPMAKNLVAAGHRVKVFDLVEEAVAPLVDAGAAASASAQDAATDIEVLISMLPASQHVESLYLGEQGVLETIDTSTLIIDCSTIAPETARTVAAVAAGKGLTMIDAPVSGGTAGAANGTLTFIVGGSEEAVASATPVLENMGKNIFRAGDSGAGQVAKICNNMLLAVLMSGTAEAIQLGVANGLDPKVLSDIMQKSSGRNWALELYNPYPGVMGSVPSSNDYQGGFGVDLMAKDLGLAMESSLQSRSATPMGALARSLYAMHSSKGAGKLDFSSIQKLFSEL